MFKRKIYSEMLQWKAISNGETALFIEGARRIGKSTVALEFAKNEYDDHLVVDFAKVGPNIRDLFSQRTRRPDNLLQEPFPVHQEKAQEGENGHHL
jgi:AAA+ ATPase superfamily predicted ATPase